MELYSTVLLLLIFSTSLITVTVTETSDEQPCKSLQYIEFGKTSILNCSFNENVFLLVWYDSTNFSDIDPILSNKKSIKSGIGYTTGEFDIHSNGSLIINTVGLEHDHYFTVVMTNSSSDDIIPFTVRAIVTVKPPVDFPVIDQCEHNKSFCFIQLAGNQNITCSVRGARPAASLKWIIKTDKTNEILPFDVSVYVEGIGYSTFATVTNSFSELPELASLACISDNSLPSFLSKKESSILVQNSKGSITHPNAVQAFTEYKSPLKLSCNSIQSSIVIWKKRPTIDDYAETSIVAVVAMNNTYTNTLEDYYMDDKGSLMTSSTEIHHEGVYTCLFGNGLAYGSNVFRVTVFVPVYPTVDGCEHQQHCILEKKYEDFLTCRLLAVRPVLELEWNIFPTRLSSKISFSEYSKNITRNGEFFDISLTSKYWLKDLSQERITVECKASSTTEYPSVIATNLDLLFLGGDQHEMHTESPSIYNQTKDYGSHIAWAVVGASVSLNIIVLIIKLKAVKATKKRKLGNGDHFNGGQGLRMVANSVPSKDLSDKKELFITHLKGTYEEMYAAIQPVPFILENMYSVNDLFVESGLEFMQSIHSKSGKRTWEPLSSYNDMFEDPRLQSKRFILDGEPGYGKSTLALKLACDWCSCECSSSLKDVDIFILLRLRQMGGRVTIPKAIKRLLLPEDSPLNEDDITTILRSCTSAVLVLDGYDEYPDSDNDENTDVKKIIRRDIFQQATVFLTTRLHCLPKQYAAQTKRIRLTGFDENCRDRYISKAVVGNNSSDAKMLKACLNENPVLSDLCQVPLFFALFAHITYERKALQSFTSVTSFFRYIITCVYGHMKNKSNSVSMQSACGGKDMVDHSKLDKEAFESLKGNRTHERWIKNVLREQIGNECFDQFISTGIMINEKVINFVDYPDVLEYEHIQYNEEVRFYHKLFCEWYAAYYLSHVATECSFEDVNKILKGFNPFKLQYLFRFACGMNPKGAPNIIKHLEHVKVPDEVLILCIIEQTGNVTSILGAVNDLCSRVIDIRKSDSRMMRRSIRQVLEIAYKQNIEISCLRFWDCFGQSREAGGKIAEDSSASLPRLKGIVCVEIHEKDQKLQGKDAAAILKYVSTCIELKTVKFCNCLLPYTMKGFDGINYKVVWYTKLSEWYILDVSSGNWKTYVSNVHEETAGQSIGASQYIEKSQYDQLVQLYRDSSLQYLSTGCVIEMSK